jgi:hypothetical protein
MSRLDRYLSAAEQQRTPVVSSHQKADLSKELDEVILDISTIAAGVDNSPRLAVKKRYDQLRDSG